jgi:DGQHR domain-containing protein
MAQVTTVQGDKLHSLAIAALGKDAKAATFIALPAKEAIRLKELNVAFVPTINTVDDDSTRQGPSAEFSRRGYQRPPEAVRIRAIAKFYRNENVLGFSTPIIIAVRKGIDSANTLRLIERCLAGDQQAIEQAFHLLAIIDGQHRFEGAVEALRQDPDTHLIVALLCIHGMSYEEETDVFNIINTTPKRLPKALTEWNKFGITDADSRDHEQEVRQIAVRLATDSDSVWFNQINLTGTGREPGKTVTLEGMRRSTENMLRTGKLRYLRLEQQLELVKTFWSAVADVFETAWADQQELVELPDGSEAMSGTDVEVDGQRVKVPRIEYRLKDLVGVASLAKLGGDILAEALGNSDAEGYVRAEVDKLSEVDWRKGGDNPWTSGHAGFAGQKGLYEALAYLRANGSPPWDE